MSSEGSPGEITVLLDRWAQGEPEALDQLTPLVYDQLRSVASSLMRNERSDHTLQPTALVHEIFEQLVNVRKVTLRDRGHFYSFAARLMRRILIDYARRMRAARRSGDLVRIPLNEELAWVGTDEVTALDLSKAMEELESVDAQKATTIELRYFLGCTVEEAAAALGVSPSSIDRDTRFSLAWLYQRLHAPLEANSAPPTP